MSGVLHNYIVQPTLRAIFLTTASLKCGNCRNGAIPSEDPPVAFLVLRGTAYI